MDPISGLILAGGRSTRFGADKAATLLDGRPLLQWVVAALDGVCSEIVVSVAPGQPVPPLTARHPLRFVADEQSGLGPLAGLVAALSAAASDLAFAASCDAPLLRPALVELLAVRAPGHDIVCTEVGGRMQPLAAVFRVTTCLPSFRDELALGQRRLTAAFTSLDVLVVPEGEVRRADPDLESFININTPADYQRVQAIVSTPSKRAGRAP